MVTITIVVKNLRVSTICKVIIKRPLKKFDKTIVSNLKRDTKLPIRGKNGGQDRQIL